MKIKVSTKKQTLHGPITNITKEWKFFSDHLPKGTIFKTKEKANISIITCNVLNCDYVKYIIQFNDQLLRESIITKTHKKNILLYQTPKKSSVPIDDRERMMLKWINHCIYTLHVDVLCLQEVNTKFIKVFEDYVKNEYKGYNILNSTTEGENTEMIFYNTKKLKFNTSYLRTDEEKSREYWGMISGLFDIIETREYVLIANIHCWYGNHKEFDVLLNRISKWYPKIPKFVVGDFNVSHLEIHRLLPNSYKHYSMTNYSLSHIDAHYYIDQLYKLTKFDYILISSKQDDDCFITSDCEFKPMNDELFGKHSIKTLKAMKVLYSLKGSFPPILIKRPREK